ncbi:MAG: tripartite tricarboxylate transporter permease, partial [Pygmaiobacter sp.]
IVAKVFAKILNIPYYVLGTFIMLLAMTGCYAYQNSMTDVYIMVAGGIFGYFFKKYNFNASALVLGLVLGPMTEKHFRRGLSRSNNNLIEFFSNPIVLGIMVIFVLLYGSYFVKAVKKYRNKKIEQKA